MEGIINLATTRGILSFKAKVLKMKKINCFMVAIYNEDFKKNLENYLKFTDYIDKWAYIVNDNIKYLPPIHLYVETSKRLKPTVIEERLKEFKLTRAFVDVVFNYKGDIRSAFDYVGYPSVKIVSNCAVA